MNDGRAAVTDLRLVPAAVTCWAVTAAGTLWSVGWLLVAVSGAAGAVVLFARHRIGTHLSALAAICVVGAGFGTAIALRADDIRDHPVTARFGTVAEVTVTPTESPRAVGRGRLLVKADLMTLDGTEAPCRVVVFASSSAFAEAAAGLPMRFRARISRPSRRDLTAATLTATGDPVLGRASAVQRMARAVRERFADAARATLPAGQAAMLPALVLGDTSALSDQVTAEFRAAGLTHLNAVSGANVTIVCGAVLLAARWIGPRAAVGAAGMALIAFVIVVQPTASVLRAAVMGAITLLAMLTARRRQAIPALAATVMALMLLAPQLAVDIGFALSVCATAALVLIAPVFSRRLVARGWPEWLAGAVAVAAAAQLVTAPLIAGISGKLSLVAVVANLGVAPVIAPITVLGTAAAPLVLCWPAAAQLLIRFTGPELWWLLAVSRWSARVPGATITVPAGLGGVVTVALSAVVLVVLWRRRSGRAVLACGAAVVVVVLLAWALSGWVTARSTVLSVRHDTIVTVSQQLHLVLGEEELLVERAIAGVLSGARRTAGSSDVPVNRLRAGEVSTSELAELLSPSLFADERVVVLEAAAEAGKDAVAVIEAAAADLPEGTLLVIVHTGGGRAKALADKIRALGAEVHLCAKLAKASERADFVRAEFRSHKVKVDEQTVTVLIDAIGSDIRELASACSQLVADTDGRVDVAAVRRYHSGKAEVKGFDIADKAVTGDVEGATESLRWAMLSGEPRVVLADALAEAVHTIARVGPLSGDPYRLAGELKMPPWRVQKAQKQSRRWSRETVATAMRLVAALNADVKGAAADADYALETAVRRVAELAADGRR